MKKILSICTIAVAAVTLSSCSDFLEQESPSEQNTNTVFNSEYYTSIALNKVYGDLCQDRTYSQDMAFIYNLNSDVDFVDGFGDNATASSERGYMNYNATPSGSYSSKMASMWTAMYGTIEDANLVIDGIEHSSIANHENMQHYLGEARTLRAMVYFDLLRIFGDLPLKLEPTKADRSNAFNEKTDRDVIMDTLMVDLEKAIDELPWAGTDSYTTEHATKGYAHALLAQIALTKAGYSIREKAKEGYETADYTDPTYPTQRPGETERTRLYKLALQHLSAVITSGKHALNPSFDNEWYLINQLTLDQTYQENIFEIPMLQNVSGELGYTVGYRLSAVTTDYGYTNSSGKVKLPATLLYSYKDSDQRRDVTIATNQIAAGDNGASVETMLKNAPFELYVEKWDPRKENATWLEQNLAASAKHPTGINPVKIRYSQVLLWYAEVMNELAGPDGSYSGDAGITARQALSQVHERAYDAANKSIAEQYIADLPADKDGFFKAIVDENAWELAGEGARKWDLIRWNLLAQKIKEMQLQYLNDLENGIFQEKVYFNYTDAKKNKIDLSSITWNGLPAGVSADAYDASETSFGDSKLGGDKSDKQIYTNLANLSSGLVGVFDPDAKTWSTPAVINRYLMPIPASTISASNGTLYNSYGYSN